MLPRRVPLRVARDLPYLSLNAFLEVTERPKRRGGPVEHWPAGQVTFYLDTLAKHTTLGISTAKRLDLPLGEFEIARTETINGPVNVREVPDVILTLYGEDQATVPIRLDKIHVTDPSIMDPQPVDDLERVPDILGTDILMKGVISVDWPNEAGWLGPAGSQIGSFTVV